ncbi:GerAB/ArcD/ProY family transporter [Paenibacillus sp. R14(2021)]|uniref:GerAB/ArcD/ProY family transporter n=1 Tax=Paenibacillus sp. R14(2021) TaxID=2859228 RepID=UPI001C613E3C
MHRIVFGKFVGNAITLVMITYFCMLTVSAICKYIDILKVWVFPTVKSWELSFAEPRIRSGL